MTTDAERASRQDGLAPAPPIDLDGALVGLHPGSPDVRSRRRLLRALARDRTGRIGIVVLVLFGLAAVFAPLLARQDPNSIDVLRKFASPSRRHLLGTDFLGRDEWARLLYGARLSLGTAVSASLAIATVGITVGVLAGYFGGAVDALISRVVEILLSFPGFLLALAVTGVLGPGLRNLLMVMVFVSWAGYARLVRALILAERGKQYVLAARSTGASELRVICRHLLPNITSPLIVLTTLDMGAILLVLAGLSFLGLGVQPPAAEWGAMLSEAKTYLGEAPQLMFYPGASIFLMVLGFNLVGDGLRDVIDPRTALSSSGMFRRPNKRASRRRVLAPRLGRGEARD
jgi:peptide/nickel transport system permease protein